MNDLEKKRLDLEKAQKQKMQDEHRLNRAEARLKNALRKQDKERTHRLIVEGAELEYIFDGIEHLPQTLFWDFMRSLSELSNVKELYSRFVNLAKNSEPNQKGGND